MPSYKSGDRRATLFLLYLTVYSIWACACFFSSVLIFAFLSEKKKAGPVKHIGFSFHDTADVLDGILTEHPEADFVQIQLNYLKGKTIRSNPVNAMKLQKGMGNP